MKLYSKELHTLCQIAISAACKAGAFIKDHHQKDLEILNKEAGESIASQVLTEVDLQSEKIILETLSNTLTAYDLGMLTEESVDDNSRFEKDYFWCIDPLDGTLAFTEGKSGYSVSIALVKKSGKSVIGVVYDPVNHNIYHAIENQGAFKNGLPFTLRNSNYNDFHTLVFDRSFLNHPELPYIKSKIDQYALTEQIEKTKFVTHGGATMNAIWVLENYPACYFKFPKPNNGCGSLWDYAATNCIFHEVELWNSDINGEKVNLNNRHTTFMNHCGMIYATSEALHQTIQDIWNDIQTKTPTVNFV